MIKMALRAACTAAAILALAPGPASAAGEMQKITIAAAENLQNLPVYIARMNGYFEEEGLEPDFVFLSSGSASVAAVLSGSVDAITTSFLQVFKAAAADGQLVAFGIQSEAFPLNIVLSKEAIAKSGITPDMPIDEKVKHLKGLNIAVSGPASSTATFARSLFQARNLNPDDYVTLQPIGAGPATWAAFQSKLVDGFSNISPWVELAESSGLGEAVIDPFKGEVPELKGVPNSVVATSRSTLEKKPELIKKFARALVRAIKFAHDDPAGVKKVSQFFPKLDPAVFNLAIEKYRSSIPAELMITEEHFTKSRDWMSLVGDSVDVTYEQVVSVEPAKTAQAELSK